jgi:hypothetical protein
MVCSLSLPISSSRAFPVQEFMRLAVWAFENAQSTMPKIRVVFWISITECWKCFILSCAIVRCLWCLSSWFCSNYFKRVLLPLTWKNAHLQFSFHYYVEMFAVICLMIERRCWVVGNSASYAGDPRFEYRSIDGLSWEAFCVLPQSVYKMAGQCIKFARDRFLPDSSQFIVC